MEAGRGIWIEQPLPCQINDRTGQEVLEALNRSSKKLAAARCAHTYNLLPSSSLVYSHGL